MDFETVTPETFGRSLTGLGINLLVTDVVARTRFLADVFGVTPHRVSSDFAIMLHDGMPFMLHSDATYAGHPLPSLLPEAGARGAGLEIRLYGTDPDAARRRAARWPDAVVLQEPTDKPHGLREAVILCPDGYAWVPSCPLPE